MREEAVVADAYAQAGDHVQRAHDREVRGRNAVTPEQPYGNWEAEEGQAHSDELGDLLIAGHEATSLSATGLPAGFPVDSRRDTALLAGPKLSVRSPLAVGPAVAVREADSLERECL